MKVVASKYKPVEHFHLFTYIYGVDKANYLLISDRNAFKMITRSLHLEETTRFNSINIQIF